MNFEKNSLDEQKEKNLVLKLKKESLINRRQDLQEIKYKKKKLRLSN
jgi:hypothetical protein